MMSCLKQMRELGKLVFAIKPAQGQPASHPPPSLLHPSEPFERLFHWCTGVCLLTTHSLPVPFIPSWIHPLIPCPHHEVFRKGRCSGRCSQLCARAPQVRQRVCLDRGLLLMNSTQDQPSWSLPIQCRWQPLLHQGQSPPHYYSLHLC